jgi:hypothetical protein
MLALSTSQFRDRPRTGGLGDTVGLGSGNCRASSPAGIAV